MAIIFPRFLSLAYPLIQISLISQMPVAPTPMKNLKNNQLVMLGKKGRQKMHTASKTKQNLMVIT